MKVYIAGPMTGLPQFNFPAFDALGARLRASGFDVVSPAELDDPDDRAAALASPDGSMATYGNARPDGVIKKTWGDFLARDVKLLADGGIEAVIVLPGWERSRGARLETFVANRMCGLPVYTYDATYDELREVPFIELVRAWSAKADISFHTPEAQR